MSGSRNDPCNPYLLLTPGPLSTTASVKSVMQRDWCTWDEDYNQIVELIRTELVRLAVSRPDAYTAVLMQGSGTFAVESTIGTALPEHGHLLVLANGAYGQRIAEIAQILNIAHTCWDVGDTGALEAEGLNAILERDTRITHVALVHCETTTGRLNPIESLAPVIKQHGKILILDAMSSFGGIPLDMQTLGIDFLISSANKCIEGIPGFGFVIAPRTAMLAIPGQARSLSLDLFAQWQTMEEGQGKWRFTSPTHVVRAFQQALLELQEEGGISVRYQRYTHCQRQLVTGMRALGFTPLLSDSAHSPIITTFLSPQHPDFCFQRFYDQLKQRGFVLYPGKVTDHDCFRIGTIGTVDTDQIAALLDAIAASRYWLAF